MIAKHVQDLELASVQAGQLLVETAEQALVKTVVAVAQARGIDLAYGFTGQIFADTFATGLVVAPRNADTGSGQHVQQRLLTTDPVLVVVAPADRREHAWQRGFGIGPAAVDLAEIEHAQFCQLRGRLPGVATQAPVRGANGFANHQHQQGRLAAGQHHRAGHGVKPDRLACDDCAAGIADQNPGH